MAPPDGFEPTTYRLTAGCSAIELQGNVNCGPILLNFSPEFKGSFDLGRRDG